MSCFRQLAFLAVVLAVDTITSRAQDLYLAMPDYNNITLSPRRIAKIPGVNSVNADNTTFDENNRRFFFLANATANGPATLFTVDAVTGAVLSSVTCPSNYASARVYGLQFDNSTNTLYALCTYSNSRLANGSLCRIDPSTGVMQPIPGISPVCCGTTTFDEVHHLYVYNSFYGVFTVDVASGIEQLLPAVLAYSNPNLLFDNLIGTLLAIGASNPPGSTGFFPGLTSISPLSGSLTQLITWGWPVAIPMTPLGASFGANGTGGIDQRRGSYFFTSPIDPDSSKCGNNRYFFVVDCSSGKIRSTSYYPYGLNTGPVPGHDQLFGFAYDQRREMLYALNWHASDSPLVQGLTIRASINPVCPGDTVLFTTGAVTSAVLPSYQWRVNGVLTDTVSGFSDTSPKNMDTIDCIVTTNLACRINESDTAAPIIIQAAFVTVPSVSISASDSNICQGVQVQFVARPVNGGPAPGFQWMVNGNTVDSPRAVFITKDLADGDVVSCILHTGYCHLSVTSADAIRMTVDPAPRLSMDPDTLILPGQSVTLAPDIGVAGKASYHWNPANGLNNATAPQVIATPDQTTTYQLTVTTDKGCSVSGNTTISVYFTLHMPNAFTPNHDGKNDLFRIPPSNPQKVIGFVVFDRWGRQVFQTKNVAEGWDGNWNGHPQPAGTYVWEIEYQDPHSGRPVRVAGTVILVR